MAISVQSPGEQTADVGVVKDFQLGSFQDSNTSPSWLVEIDWGDSQNTSYFISEEGTLSIQTHTYAVAATRTVTVTITSTADDTVGSTTFRVVVGGGGGGGGGGGAAVAWTVTVRNRDTNAVISGATVSRVTGELGVAPVALGNTDADGVIIIQREDGWGVFTLTSGNRTYNFFYNGMSSVNVAIDDDNGRLYYTTRLRIQKASDDSNVPDGFKVYARFVSDERALAAYNAGTPAGDGLPVCMDWEPVVDGIKTTLSGVVFFNTEFAKMAQVVVVPNSALYSPTIETFALGDPANYNRIIKVHDAPAIDGQGLVPIVVRASKPYNERNDLYTGRAKVIAWLTDDLDAATTVLAGPVLMTPVTNSEMACILYGSTSETYRLRISGHQVVAYTAAGALTREGVSITTPGTSGPYEVRMGIGYSGITDDVGNRTASVTVSNATSNLIAFREHDDGTGRRPGMKATVWLSSDANGRTLVARPGIGTPGLGYSTIVADISNVPSGSYYLWVAVPGYKPVMATSVDLSSGNQNVSVSVHFFSDIRTAGPVTPSMSPSLANVSITGGVTPIDDEDILVVFERISNGPDVIVFGPIGARAMSASVRNLFPVLCDGQASYFGPARRYTKLRIGARLTQPSLSTMLDVRR